MILDTVYRTPLLFHVPLTALFLELLVVWAWQLLIASLVGWPQFLYRGTASWEYFLYRVPRPLRDAATRVLCESADLEIYKFQL